MSEREYTCALCHGTFEPEWTDAEAEAEFKQLFPHRLDEPRDVICDDCFRIVCPGGKPVGPS